MIAVIDYGVGNLFSLTASLKYIGADVAVTADKEVLQAADKLILPGVGAFRDARAKLFATGLVDTLYEQVEAGKPLLGICLGMQMLFDKSYEYGEYDGLGLIPGNVRYIETDLKVPQIGWNSITIKEDPLFKYAKNGDYVYYVHSYCATECEADTIAVSDYHVPITGAVHKGNVWGTQFHPEKSGNVGLGMLRAFNEL